RRNAPPAPGSRSRRAEPRRPPGPRARLRGPALRLAPISRPARDDRSGTGRVVRDSRVRSRKTAGSAWLPPVLTLAWVRQSRSAHPVAVYIRDATESETPRADAREVPVRPSSDPTKSAGEAGYLTGAFCS